MTSTSPHLRCRDILGEVHLVAAHDLVNRHSAYAVHVCDGAVLLVQDPTGHAWHLPGGGVEPGESLIDALVREVMEETGLHVVPPVQELLSWTEHFYDVVTEQGWRSMRTCFLVPIVRGELRRCGNGDDVLAAGFVPLTDVDRCGADDATRMVLARGPRRTRVRSAGGGGGTR